MRLCAVLLAVIGLASGANAGELNQNLFGTLFPKYQATDTGTPRLPNHRRAASRPEKATPHRNTVPRSTSAVTSGINENLIGTVFPKYQATDSETPDVRSAVTGTAG
jgi:hypothetical protein